MKKGYSKENRSKTHSLSRKWEKSYKRRAKKNQRQFDKRIINNSY